MQHIIPRKTTISWLFGFSQHRCLKKIVIETIEHNNDVCIIECEEELVVEKSLFKFDGRKNLFHRSKVLKPNLISYLKFIVSYKIKLKCALSSFSPRGS